MTTASTRSGGNPLHGRLREEMGVAGVIPFERFMEVALYDPEFGYYEQRRRVGRGGDFYTSVSVGALFGGLLAWQFAQWLRECLEERPGENVRIVEAGAHDGRLAADILEALTRLAPDLEGRMEYWILEPSRARRLWQGERLAGFAGRIRWVQTWAGLDGGCVRGVIFSNELLDAFPVRRFGWDAGARCWFEWGVRMEGDGLTWVRMDPGAGEGRACEIDLPAELLEALPDGFSFERSPSAVDWWREAATRLERGRLMTIDYGAMSEGPFGAGNPSGSLRAYCGHRPAADILANPGGQDITADVKFSEIRAAGEGCGLDTKEFLSQGQFLTRIAGTLWRETPPAADEVRQFQTLTHPEHLGRRFSVLAQAR